MPANYTPTRCVNKFPSVFTHIGISIQKPEDSHPDTTRPVALKMWWCLFFNVQDLIVKTRACKLQGDKIKLTASVLMGFVFIAILCLKQRVTLTTFFLVKSSSYLSLKKISNAAERKENLMKLDKAINRRKFSPSLNCGNASGGDLTRQSPVLNYIPERVYLSTNS